MILAKRFDIFPPDWGCSEGPDAFIFFLTPTTLPTVVLELYDSDDHSSIGGFSFVHIECVPRPVHESHTVFDRKAASSAQGHLFLSDPQNLLAATFTSTKQLTSAYPQGLVLWFPRLSNSGAVVKSVVIIFIL